MAKIHESTDYNKFNISSFNRDVKKTSKLEASMKKHGWIDAYPAHVHKKNGNFDIKAGHHRFIVASSLGIPVKFVICEDEATIHDLEAATTPWSQKDYLASYIRCGNKNYAELGEYCEKTGISLITAASMFYGEAAGSHNVCNHLKTGTFVVKDRNHPHMVASIVELIKKSGFSGASTKLYVYAISRILFVKELDISRLKKKIKAHPQFLEMPRSMIDAQDMLEEVYNKQAQDRLPLSFLADAVAKERMVVKRK